MPNNGVASLARLDGGYRGGQKSVDEAAVESEICNPKHNGNPLALSVQP